MCLDLTILADPADQVVGFLCSSTYGVSPIRRFHLIPNSFASPHELVNYFFLLFFFLCIKKTIITNYCVSVNFLSLDFNLCVYKIYVCITLETDYLNSLKLVQSLGKHFTKRRFANDYLCKERKIFISVLLYLYLYAGSPVTHGPILVTGKSTIN